MHYKMNGHVTWAHLLGVLGLSMTALSGLMMFVWGAHAEHPHKDAVSRSEMVQFEKRIDAGFGELSRRLDSIDKKLERDK